MPLDQPTVAFLEMLAGAGGKPVSEGTVEEARAQMALGAALGAPPADVGGVVEREIDVPGGHIGLRIYTPATTSESSLPVVLQYHGGGFVLGNLDSHDAVARYYCAHGNAIVVSVDYRLAPEHRFPTQVEDSYAALTGVAAQAGELGADAARLAVTGDSAGGNLATVMCLLARARGGPRIAYQVLVYPVTDFRVLGGYPSHNEFGGGNYFLSTADMDWFRALYFSDVVKEVEDPRGSPMAETDLSGLPPALVVTVGYDPLRDEGRAYADRLAAAGVPVEYRCFETTIHASASFAGAIPSGLEILDFVSSRLRTALQSGAVAASGTA
jgi:acetyl esterase